jgi:hypothetical protein
LSRHREEDQERRGGNGPEVERKEELEAEVEQRDKLEPEVKRNSDWCVTARSERQMM